MLLTIKFIHHVTAADYSPFFDHFSLVPSKGIMYFKPFKLDYPLVYFPLHFQVPYYIKLKVYEEMLESKYSSESRNANQINLRGHELFLAACDCLRQASSQNFISHGMTWVLGGLRRQEKARAADLACSGTLNWQDLVKAGLAILWQTERGCGAWKTFFSSTTSRDRRGKVNLYLLKSYFKKN